MSRLDPWTVIRQSKDGPVVAPFGSVSALDLKAPGKARSEYAKGYASLMRKDYDSAVVHLANAVSIYPAFVAAHNALGSAYLELGQSRMARDEFAEAISLDEHLPGSYLNLGCAELALEDYSSAVESVQKASTLAPLDMQVVTALSYAEFMNGDYASVINGSRRVHSRKHEGAAMVHYYAAAAWQRQRNLPEMRSELRTFLAEDPHSPRAAQAEKTLNNLKAHEGEDGKSESDSRVSTQEASIQQELARQDSREEIQIAEAAAWVRSTSQMNTMENKPPQPVKSEPNLQASRTDFADAAPSYYTAW